MAKKKNKLQPVGTYANKVNSFGKGGNTSNAVGTYRQNVQDNLNAYMKRIREQQALNAAANQGLQGIGLGVDMAVRKPITAATNQSLQGSTLGADMALQSVTKRATNQSLRGATSWLDRLGRTERVLTGTTEKPGWLGGIPEETRQALKGKNALQTIKDAENLQKQGYWDETDDMSLWSDDKRKNQRNQWVRDTVDYQKQIDDLQKQIDANREENADVKYGKLVKLYTSPEVENELKILNRQSATAEEKENARLTLEKLYAGAGLGGNSAYQNAQDYAESNNGSLDMYLGNRQGMRKSAYDAMNGNGAYDQATKSMNQLTKQNFDNRIDEALTEFLDPNGKPGIDLRTAKMQLENTQDKINQLNKVESREADYQSFMAGRDYADTEYHPENNVYKQIIDTNEEDNSFGGQTYAIRPVDIIYSILGGENGVTNYDITDSKYGKAALISDVKGPDGYSERDIFMSYYNAGLYDEAEAFYKGLEQTALNQRYHYFEQLKWETQASRIPVSTSLATLAATPLQTVEFIANIPDRVKALIYGEQNAATDEYSDAYSVTRFKNIIRNQISENLGSAGWIYQGIMSGADSALNVALGKGIGLTGNALQYGTLALFGTQAFETSLQNKLETGSDNFAYDWIESWIDAAIETATEIWSVENLMADPTNILQFVGKLAISEPSEEVAGAILGPYIKEILGHKNEWKERARQILGAGGYQDSNGEWVKVTTADAATRQAMREWNHEIRMSAQSALISVAPGGMYGVAQNAYRTTQQGNEILNTPGGLQGTLGAAMNLDQNTAAYQLGQKMQQRAEEGKKNSAYKVGQLTQDIVREGSEIGNKKLHDTTRQFVTDQLKEAGVQDEKITNIITKALEGKGIESLTDNERRQLNGNHAALNVYAQMRHAGETREQLKNARSAATENERNAVNSMADILTYGKVMNNQQKGDGVHLATAEDIRNATGSAALGARGVIVSGANAKLDNIRITKENGKLKTTYEVTVDGKQQTVDASDILATDLKTAQIIQLARDNPQFYSEKFANRLLEMQERGELKGNNALNDARLIRLHGYTGLQMPTTSLDTRLANELYMQSQQEHAENRRAQVGENRNEAGKGKATFKGAEFGTEAWDKATADLDKATKDEIDGIAQIVKVAGIEADFTEQDDTKTYGWQKGKQIGLNINGLNYGIVDGKVQPTGRHSLLVTFGHEMTHWLQANSLKGYNRLEQYIMQQFVKNSNTQELIKRLDHHMLDNGYTLEEAMSEIVADGCDQILSNEEVVEHIQETDKTLFKEIQGFVTNLVDRIKTAIHKMRDSASYDARIMARGANDLHKLWLGAYDEALSNIAKGQSEEQAERKSQADTNREYSALDADYMDAVNNNDLETAEMLVSQAAELAGYNIEGYHGTDADFTEFKIGDIGFHIGSAEQAQSRMDQAGNRSWQNNNKSKIMHLFAKLQNPLVIDHDFGDWHGKNVAEMLLEVEQFEEGYDENAEEINARLREIAKMPEGGNTDKVLREYLQSLGYDGIQYENQFEGVDRDEYGWSEDFEPSYILFNSDQLKSADAITYDDNGNFIPLSERFNTEKPDIRWSIAELPDGQKYVNVDTDQNIFDGVEPKDYSKIVFKFIRDKFRGEQLTDDDTLTVNRKAAKEYASKKMNITEGEYNAKAHAAPELDNLFAVSEFVTHTEDNGKHPDAVGGWDYYRTVLKFGDRFFEGTINVMNRKYDRIFYDMNKIRDITNDIPDKYGIGAGNIPTSSIAETGQNDNTRFSRADEQTIQALRNAAPEHIRTNMEARNRIYNHYGIKENDILFGIEFNEDGTVNYDMQDRQEAELIKKISKADLKTLKNLQEDTEKWRRVWKEDAEINTEDYYKNAAELDKANEYAKQNPEDHLFGSDFVRPKEIFAAPVKMYGDFAAVNYRPLDMDNEYETAVRNGDMKKAERMLLEKYNVLTMTGTDLTGYRAPFIYNGEHKNIAKLIKSGDAEVVRLVAEQMAPQVPDNAVLVPMPPHTGTVTDNTDTMILAKAIGEITGRPVVNALASDEHISRNVAKKEGVRGVTADAMKMRQIEVLPAGTFPVFIDNVVGGGATAEAAKKAIGYGITLSYAQSSRAKSKGVKLVAVTYDNEGNLIPLSERMNLDNPSWKYSKADDMTNLDAGVWLATVSEWSGLKTEDERILKEAYNGKRLSIALSLHKQLDYKTKIRQLENKEHFTDEDRVSLTRLNTKLEDEKNKFLRLEEEMSQIQSQEGYAGYMYRNNVVLDDFVQGKTSEQVTETVNAMLEEVKAANEEIKQRAEELKQLEQTQAVKAMKSFLGKTSLSQQAAILRKQYNSTLTKSEVEDRLAAMALKLAAGQDIQSDAEGLATDLANKIRGERTDNLSYIRGATLTVGEDIIRELKAEGSSLNQLKNDIFGSGVKLIKGEKSHFIEQWDELRKNNEELVDAHHMDNQRNALQAIVDFIKDELDASTGRQQFKVDLDDMTAVCYASAASVTTYLVKDPAAKKQITELMNQIKDLSTQTGGIAERLEQLGKKMERVVHAGYKAADWAGILQRDMNGAIEYYNKVAALAAKEERTKVRKDLAEQLRSESAKKLYQVQDEYRKLITENRKARQIAEDNAVLRRKVDNRVKFLQTRLLAETDKKNIPEETKALARELVNKLITHDLSGVRRILFEDSEKLKDAKQRLKLQTMAAEGKFDADRDLNWLVIDTGTGEKDYSIRDQIANDLRQIDNSILMYWTAEGNKVNSLEDRKQALLTLQKAVDEIYSAIKARGEAFIKGKRYEVAALGAEAEAEMEKSAYKGERTGRGSKAMTAIENAIGYGNLTPEYYFKNLKNKVFSLLFDGLKGAENRNGLLAQKAQADLAKIAEETGFSTWDGQQKHSVKVNNIRNVEMTTEQIMALYATWQRERNQLRPEMTAHLLRGGFVLGQEDKSKGRPGREKADTRPIRIDRFSLESLGQYLTDKQKEYVNRVVKYLSEDMAALGNEASMEAYGVKKFTEQYYFPIKSWGGVLAQESSQGVVNNNENKAFRPGFSNRVTAGAQNAIEISDFTATATKHIVGMITFNTIGPAVENMNKVLNYKLQYGDVAYNEEGEVVEDDRYERSVRAAFESAYGKNAANYLKQFMKDINGGTANGPGNTVWDKLLSTFKKNAVAGSLSVAAQQPLSYIRAAMMINPKYLAKGLTSGYKGAYEELLKYSGVAVLKHMGKFDMNFGRSMIDYITPETVKSKGKAAVEWISDKSTALPQLLDDLTWARMWVAVKAEQKAMHPNMDEKSEAFLQMAADRFNDLMRRTQVYDSVMVKSQNMRNNHPFAKTITSFMAEPTLSLNVLADAWQNIKAPGGKANAAKALATFLMSAAAQAAAKAMFSAGRSPDKKKNREENYLYRLSYNLINEMNPLNLIPGYSNIVDLLKNGELTDNSMSVLAKAKDALVNMKDLFVGSEKKNWYRSFEDSVGQILQIATDVPVKNFMRDFRAMVNLFSNGTAEGLTGGGYAQRETSKAVLKYQTLDLLHTEDLIGLINSELGNSGYKTGYSNYVQRIVDAEKADNKSRAQGITEYLLLGKGKQEKQLNSDINSLIKKDEGLSAEKRLQMLEDHGYKNMASQVLEEYRKGELTREQAEKMYREENPAADDKKVMAALDEVEYELKNGKIDNYSNYTPVYDALAANKADEIKEAIKHMLDGGYQAKDIKTQINKKIKEQYMEADSQQKIKLRDAMQKAYKAMGLKAADADKVIEGWTKPKKTTKKTTK